MTPEENKILIEIAANVATNMEATRGIEDHLRVLNGKIVGHESRLQSIEGAHAITSLTVTEISKTQERRKNVFHSFVEKSMWALITIFAIGAWNVFSFLINDGVLARIIK